MKMKEYIINRLPSTLRNFIFKESKDYSIAFHIYNKLDLNYVPMRIKIKTDKGIYIYEDYIFLLYTNCIDEFIQTKDFEIKIKDGYYSINYKGKNLREILKEKIKNVKKIFIYKKLIIKNDYNNINKNILIEYKNFV